MRLELHLSLDGAAFGATFGGEVRARHEANRILTQVGADIERDGYELDTPRRIKDINGNRCGYWLITDKDPGCGDPDCTCPECPTGQKNSVH